MFLPSWALLKAAVTEIAVQTLTRLRLLTQGFASLSTLEGIQRKALKLTEDLLKQ